MTHHHQKPDTCQFSKFIFDDATPKQPKEGEPPLELKDYVNLLKLVDSTNKSSLFIAHNDQASAFAKQLDDKNKNSGQTTFPDHVHVIAPLPHTKPQEKKM